MAIHKPQRELLAAVPLRFVRSRVRGGGRKSVDSSITLVPFIDLLVSLVVFLLASFGANETSADVRLPAAQHASALEQAPVIVVSGNVVTLEGHQVADVASLQARPALERIEALVTGLETARQNWVILHPSSPSPATVILQADEGVDYRVVRKVVYSATQAGYPNVSLAVQRRGAR